MKVLHVTTGAFQAHTFFLMCERTRETLLIDPGQHPEPILQMIRTHQLNVTHLVGTHAHLDHVWSVGRLKKETGAPFYLHPDDEPIYQNMPEWGLLFGFQIPTPPPIDIYLKDGDVLKFGDEALNVRHVPGHSPGHVMLYNATDAWVGDCLFQGSIGRTDLPGGDTQTLLDTIHQRILSLGDKVKVYPGHGLPTTIAEERRSNPFLRGHIGRSVLWQEQ